MVTASGRTALLAGATGLVGGHCLELLLRDDAWEQVAVLGRREIGTTHRKLVQRVVDFDRLAELGDVPRVDDVFCCLGTTMKRAGSEAAFRRVDFTYVHELAQLASRQRAGQFLLVSALGADRQSRVFYYRVKGEVEEAVRKLSFDGVHIFRPSLLLGERRESRPGERLAVLAGRALGFMFVGPLGGTGRLRRGRSPRRWSASPRTPPAGSTCTSRTGSGRLLEPGANECRF